MFAKKKEPKLHEPTQRELLTSRIASEIEQLTPGQTLIYRLPQFYWGGYAAFFMGELNPTYPQKGKKYLACIDQIVDGKLAGKKTVAWQTDKSTEIAQWIAERDGEYGPVERYQ